MNKLTRRHLTDIGVKARYATEYADSLNATMERYEINTPLRQAHFLAQVLHESGMLVFAEEIWGPTASQKRYDPPGNLARILGNTEKGDGYKFRGRGLIQLTGRDNYSQYAEALNKELNPILPKDYIDEETVVEMMSDPYWIVDSAGWFWDTRGLNRWADVDDIREVTRRINGGYNGLFDRQRLLKSIRETGSLFTNQQRNDPCVTTKQ